MTATRTAIIMAGGTGGHVYPGLAVADYLRDAGWTIRWIGTARGLESRVVPEHGIALHALKTLGLRGKGPVSTVKGIASLVYACGQALSVLIRHRPAVVIGFGGYAAGPAGAVAKALGIPLIIHEQNAVVGTTNRLLARFATRVMAGFEGAFHHRRDVLVTGNPIRADLARHPNKSYPEQKFDKARPLRLAILGGSQGAMALNCGIPKAVAALPVLAQQALEVRHQCGRDHLSATHSLWSRLAGTEVAVMPFVDDMAALYAWADIAVCRAGALTVSELAVTGTPSLLVPLPQAIDNHQLRNAQALELAGGAVILPQDSLNSDELSRFLSEVLTDPQQLRRMSQCAREWSRPQATQAVAAVAQEVARG